MVGVNNVVVTNDGREYKKPTAAQNAAGYMAGSLAGGVATTMIKSPAGGMMKKMQKIAQSADVTEINNGLHKALEVSGMKSKGVELIDYAIRDVKVKSIFDIINENKINLKADGIKGSFVKAKNMLTGIASSSAQSMAKNGTNAFFSPKNKILGNNKIHINTAKLGTAGFHEIGHAINYNSSTFWRAMQKARGPLMKLPAVFLLTALCKRKKAPGEQPKGLWDKATTFVKEHVGALSFAAMLPVVAEELKATARGNKLAKQLLSPENFKKVAKTNAFGAATYILAAVATGVGAYAANKVKDCIAAPKEVKQEA